MRLTRPHRRWIYSITFVMLWCSVAVFLLMPTSYVFRTTFAAGGAGAPAGTGALTWGDAEWTFGLLKYLTIEYRDVDLSGVPAGPNPQEAWNWQMPAALLTLLILMFVAGLCRTAFLYSMKKDRLVGRCDECGYDLTGLRSNRCPECGSRVKSCSDDEPSDGDSATATEERG